MRRFLAFVVVLSAVAFPVFTAGHVAIYVDDDAAPGGNGSKKRPYSNLPDAVAAANAVSGDVTIQVEPGDYPLDAPLVIARPLDLRGSTVEAKEHGHDHDRWPTGEAKAGTETRVFSTHPESADTLIVVGRTDGGVMRDVRISGFIFEGSLTGTEVLLTRVQDFRVEDNVFRAPGMLGMQTVASSGRAKGNHFSGVSTGAIFAAGYPASPAEIVFTGNRSVGNILGGALLNGASINIPELGDQLDAVIRDNDLSENVGNLNQSFGLRLFIMRRDLGAPGETQSSGHVQALVQDNRMQGNRFGMVIDAGFPYRRVGTVCDSRVYSGTIDLRLVDNLVADNQVSPGLVTFTRNTTAIVPTQLPLWQYLHGATFSISDRDGALAGAIIDHPAADPFLGPCAADTTHEPLGNVLILNGSAVPPRS